MTQLGYGDKVYVHNIFETYTYNNESLILVDTTVSRTVRLCQTVMYKRSVVIKDISGNANTFPIIIELIGNATNGVTLFGQTGRVFQMFVPWGAVEFACFQHEWSISVPRSTVISDRAFRLPQNLNLALPPAIGAFRQSFPTLVFFPATMLGTDIVPAAYNGFSASVHSPNQITLTNPSDSALTSIFLVPNPVINADTFEALTITATTVFNIPTDFPSLSAAFAYLANQQIMPGVTVYLQETGDDSISSLLLIDHPQSDQIVIQGPTPYLFTPLNASFSSTIPGAVNLTLLLDNYDFSQMTVGDYVIIDQAIPSFQRWTGIWPIVSASNNLITLQISDWGASFPTTTPLATQIRFQLVESVITVAGNGTIQLYADGLTIENIAFVGASNAATAISAFGVLNLDTVGFANFTANGLLAGAKGVINATNLYLSTNSTGLNLTRGSVLNGDISPSTSGVYITGNATGLYSSNSSVLLTPVYVSGNQNFGLSFDSKSFGTITNSYITNNASVGLSITNASVAKGSNNTILTNGTTDISVAELSLVNMTDTSSGVILAGGVTATIGTPASDGSLIAAL
jgi:hypothetical protein